MKMCKAVPSCKCTNCKLCEPVWELSKEVMERLIEILIQEEEKYKDEKK